MGLFHSLLPFFGMWRWITGEMESFCLGAKCSQGVSLKEDSVPRFLLESLKLSLFLKISFIILFLTSPTPI
jgi:hypothetical protein